MVSNKMQNANKRNYGFQNRLHLNHDRPKYRTGTMKIEQELKNAILVLTRSNKISIGPVIFFEELFKTIDSKEIQIYPHEIEQRNFRWHTIKFSNKKKIKQTNVKLSSGNIGAAAAGISSKCE